jgi:hypothetical protein
MGNKLRDKTTQASSKRNVTVVLPELQSLDLATSNPEEEQVIVGRLYYRPSLFQLLATDLAHPMVRYGHACVESEMFMKNTNTAGSRITDSSTGLETLRKDIIYLEQRIFWHVVRCHDSG